MQLVAEKRKDVARPLRILVPLIKEELEAGDEAGLEHYRRAGEMLLEAREQVEHGEWYGWLDRNFALSRSQADRYMKLVIVESKSRATRTFSTLSEAVSPNRGTGRASWHEPVQQIASRVRVDALAEERQNREKESRLLHQLSMQLIDIGYKVLAAKLHPDKGGSAEAMARLNKVRNILREAL